MNKASVNTVKENDASGNLDMTAEFTVYSLKDALGKMNTGAAGEKTGLDRVKERDAANMAAIDEAKNRVNVILLDPCCFLQQGSFYVAWHNR